MFYLLLLESIKGEMVCLRGNLDIIQLQVISDALRTNKGTQDTKELELQSTSSPLYEQYLVLNSELFSDLPTIQFETCDFKFLTSSNSG